MHDENKDGRVDASDRNYGLNRLLPNTVKYHRLYLGPCLLD